MGSCTRSESVSSESTVIGLRRLSGKRVLRSSIVLGLLNCGKCVRARRFGYPHNCHVLGGIPHLPPVVVSGLVGQFRRFPGVVATAMRRLSRMRKVKRMETEGVGRKLGLVGRRIFTSHRLWESR